VIGDFLEQVLHGLTLGSMYAMVAAGLALMLGVARLINFAHGEFFMLGAYAFWLGYSELGLAYPVAALLAPAVMVVFGVVYQRTVIRAILPRSWHVQLIATLATSIVLTNLAIIVLGTQPKEVPTALSSRILDVAGFRVAWQRLLVLVAALVIFWALHRFVARTRTGRAMRAMSQNREACAVVGVDVQRVTLVTFALSAALAALAAADAQGVRGRRGGRLRLRQRRDRGELSDRHHRGARRQLRLLRVQGCHRVPHHDRGAPVAAAGTLRPPHRHLTCGTRPRGSSSPSRSPPRGWSRPSSRASSATCCTCSSSPRSSPRWRCPTT
jgi:branched-chain amino acid transport system permease protein